MSHEFESGVFYKEAAWHKLGTVIDHVMTAKEAITAAGLDWEVLKVPIYTENNQGVFVEVKGMKGIQRSTDGHMLSVLGDGYEPVQNRDAFEFFDSVVATDEAKYHTAGSLMNGRKIWMLAKLDGKNGPINIKGDQVDKYLLLTNGHDGMSALKMFFTPVRVVCMNTLMAAENRTARSEMFYSRHSGQIKDRMEAARQILGISLKFYDTFTENCNRLASLQLPPAELGKLLEAAFGKTVPYTAEGPAPEVTKSRQEKYDYVTRLFEGAGKGLDNPDIKGTMWSAYNAVVEYVDYGKEYKGANPDDTRLKNTWFGSGATIKQNAWNYLAKLAK